MFLEVLLYLCDIYEEACLGLSPSSTITHFDVRVTVRTARLFLCLGLIGQPRRARRLLSRSYASCVPGPYISFDPLLENVNLFPSKFFSS